MFDSRGSIWRKWDLHFHTPSSYDYKSKSISNNDIINDLTANGIEVVAVTDHHLMDVGRIRELQQIGKGKITVLPGIEFRSDIVLSSSLHFIGIFSEESDIEKIWDTLRIKLNIDVTKVLDRTEEPKLSFSLKEASELIHELGGIVTVHAGTKSNSFENITNDFSHTKELKKNILLDGCIDILEVGKLSDINSYRKIVFPSIGAKLPLIICSDNHDVKNYIVKENLWIKGDANFINLKQIFNQPERIFIGNKPVSVQNVEDNPTKYIDNIKINKKEGSTFGETWFNNVTIALNSGLVAIIGNKGNGKSALTDIIGLCGNTRNADSFSFLNKEKFRKNKSEKASNFEASLTWKNGKTIVCALNQDVDAFQDERIKYIPQSFLENLCDSVEDGDFEMELKSIIFSHIPQHERLGKNNLDELIYHKTQIIRSDIEKHRGELAIVNGEILLLEAKENPNYLKKLEDSLRLKEEELFAHQQSKPSHKLPPTELDDSDNIENEKITLLRDEREQILVTVQDANLKIGILNEDIEILNQRKQSIQSLKISVEQELHANNEILAKYNIKAESLFSFDVNVNPIDDAIKNRYDSIVIYKEVIKQDGKSLNRITSIDNELAELQNKLEQPSKDYQDYLSALTKWDRVEQEIIGTKDAEGTILSIQSLIEYVKNQVKGELKIQYDYRKEIVQNIFKKKESIIEISRDLFKSVTEFIETHKELMDSYKISFDTIFRENDLYNRFKQMINFNSIGSFSGVNEGMAKLIDYFEGKNFNDSDETYKFVEDVLHDIKYYYRKGEKNYSDINSQIKGGHKPLDLYNFICGLDYLTPTYDLKLSDKNVATLSPGERGALLLIFYLILDNNNIPLIIDQPEENLDNQSVYKILVPFIKMAKSRRQVIIVTHNPNLAVVCDADQIVHIKIDKENKNEVVVQSGGLENSNISSKIVEILEGTFPAFSTRTNTYKLHVIK